MKFALLLFFFGLAAVVVSGLGLAWDGAFQLVNILASQSPDVPYARFTQAPLFAIVVAVSHLTLDSGLLALIFSGLHAALTLGAFVGAWWIVRRSAPHLFVWAALGIGLIALPAQACLVCQSNTVFQLFWVLLLAILVGMERRTAWLWSKPL